MNNNKLAKLQAIQKELISLLELSQRASQLNEKPKLPTVAIKYGLNILLNKNNYNEKIDSRNRTQTASITPSFKAMIPLVKTAVDSSCVEASKSLLKDFKKLNTYENIVPEKQRLEKILVSYLKNLEKSMIKILDKEAFLIFSQGKQHQNLSSGLKSVAKFLEYNEKDTVYFNNHLKNAVKYVKSNISIDIFQSELNELYLNKVSSDKIITFLKKISKIISNRTDSVLGIVSWWTYTQGNLYQLSKDNVQFVRWSTSHCLHDCIECSNIENGQDKIVIEGKKIPSFMNENGAVYNFKDIKSYIGNYGMEMLSHKDCRCQFVKAI